MANKHSSTGFKHAACRAVPAWQNLVESWGKSTN